MDDEEDLLDILEHTLAPICNEITRASNGQKALEAHKNNLFDVILSDLNMPVLGGIELLLNLRESGFSTPFIILTAYGDNASTVAALRLGAFDFLAKPFDSAKVSTVISNALKLAKSQSTVDQDLKRVFAAAGDSGSFATRDPEQVREVLQSMQRLKGLLSNYGKKDGEGEGGKSA